MRQAGKKKGRVPLLDLHGVQTANVPQRVDDFLMKHQKQPYVRIMTGRGTGKVRTEVQKYLKLGRYSWSHEVLESGGQNPGVLIVEML